MRNRKGILNHLNMRHKAKERELINPINDYVLFHNNNRAMQYNTLHIPLLVIILLIMQCIHPVRSLRTC